MAFLGADGKLTRFADFNRVAAWLDHRRGPSTADATADAAGDAAGDADR